MGGGPPHPASQLRAFTKTFPALSAKTQTQAFGLGPVPREGSRPGPPAGVFRDLKRKKPGVEQYSIPLRWRPDIPATFALSDLGLNLSPTMNMPMEEGCDCELEGPETFIIYYPESQRGDPLELFGEAFPRVGEFKSNSGLEF